MQNNRKLQLLGVTRGSWLAVRLNHLWSAYGITTDITRDLGSARRALQSQNYDAVILDTSEGVSTVEFCRSLRDGSVVLPVLVVGEETSVAEVVKALDGGAKDYLGSSMSDEEFAARIVAACSHRSR